MVIKVTSPQWTARLTIKNGVCTEADPELVECLGASVQWCKAHIVWFHRWEAVIERERPAAPAQLDLALG